jgi:hypothetical protein
LIIFGFRSIDDISIPLGIIIPCSVKFILFLCAIWHNQIYNFTHHVMWGEQHMVQYTYRIYSIKIWRVITCTLVFAWKYYGKQNGENELRSNSLCTGE